jgi:hypothetical protein
MAKKIKSHAPKKATTWAPYWTDTGTFHLHPSADRYPKKPPDADHDGRTMSWVRVLIVPITPKRRKKK